jgi:hypothetical protein
MGGLANERRFVSYINFFLLPFSSRSYVQNEITGDTESLGMCHRHPSFGCLSLAKIYDPIHIDSHQTKNVDGLLLLIVHPKRWVSVYFHDQKYHKQNNKRIMELFSVLASRFID